MSLTKRKTTTERRKRDGENNERNIFFFSISSLVVNLAMLKEQIGFCYGGLRLLRLRVPLDFDEGRSLGEVLAEEQGEDGAL